MNTEQATALRKEFDTKEIGLKPQVNCKACTNASRQQNVPPRDKHCDRHAIKTCNVCQNWITEGHVHLDFVGHAAATDRLRQVDPERSNPLAATYLNRLSDLLFILARVANPAGDVMWVPGGDRAQESSE